jgi:hypothetical protein
MTWDLATKSLRKTILQKTLTYKKPHSVIIGTGFFNIFNV